MRRLLSLLLLCASAALAQEEEPTPFWIAPPPPAKKKESPKKKKKPVQIKPLEMKEPPPAEKKPPAAVTRKKPSEPPTWIEPTPLPEPSPHPARAPIPVEQTAPVLTRQPAAPIPVEQTAPAVTRTPPAPVAAPLPTPIAPAPLPPAPPIIAEPEPEPLEAAEVRTWSFDLFAGGWAKSRSDGAGRSWDLAYGLRAGYGLFGDQLEVELQLIRSGGTSGSPFVSTSATHNLVGLRAFWVLGNDFALLVGGGGGVTLSQTHYTLVDVISGTAAGLDANAIRPVMQITAAGRVRLFRGLQLRGEVSAILRDGRVEPMPLLGLGWAL